MKIVLAANVMKWEKNNAYNLDANGNKTDEGCGCMIDMQSNQYDYLDHPLTKDTIIEDAKLEYFANDPKNNLWWGNISGF